jgi:transposase
MEKSKNPKHENLKKAGLFNPEGDKVKDPLFLDYPEFFDPCDNLQVRYEVLRSHLIEKDTITRVCKRFGISRQTFYTLRKKFEREGTAGLLPNKPGPRGPRKLTVEVLAFVEKSLDAEEDISAERIKTLVHERFGVSLHKRTVEKLWKELRVKKNSGK